MKAMILVALAACVARSTHATDFKWGCSGRSSDGQKVQILGGYLFEGGDYYETGDLKLYVNGPLVHSFKEKAVSISGDGHVLNVLANSGGTSLTIRHRENKERQAVIRVDVQGTLIAIDDGTCRFKQLADRD